MAHNYSQPYHGAHPYAYAHPQLQLQPPPGLQSEEHAGPPPRHQALAHDVFQSIPGLHPPALPGINFASHGQNNQQPPFPPPSWSSQLPDPNLWLPFLQQNGMVPPPPLPGLGGLPPLSLPQTPHNHPMPMGFPLHAPPHLLPQRTAAASERIQEVMDSDREDGELSDADIAAKAPFGKASSGSRVDPPRSMPPASKSSSRIEEAYNPDRPAAGQSSSQQATHKALQHESPPSLADQMHKSREEAKQFVKVLNSNSIGYRTLAQEQLDTELLRGLYQSLNLPSEPASILPPKPNGIALRAPPPTSAAGPKPNSVIGNNNQHQKSAPAVKANVVPASSVKPVASPTASGGDRKDYIARLQAAKLAKQAGGTRFSPPQQTHPAKSAAPVPVVMTPRPTTPPTTKPPVTDEQRARNTELIKQRLEAMRANQKPKLPPANNRSIAPIPSSSSTPIQRSEPNQGALEHFTQPLSSSTGTPNHLAHVPTFPGIPGLFMNASPTTIAPPIASRPAPSIPLKRPAPADSTEVSTPRGSVTPYAQPLGQSPHTQQEEDDSMIIEVSDDETNGSDMDLDDDQSIQERITGSSIATQDQRQAPGVFPNFSARSDSAKPQSAVSTPGPQTPALQAREKELEDKEKQLAAMRLTLKKKLAEKREKDRAAAAAMSSPLRQNPPTPGLLTITRANTSSSAVHAIADPARDVKRLRRAEIQSRLPTLDAEIANNASRMAQLTKEMEQLMAQNERIARDKEQLTQELESLGIDTEGMSHAELRAKKDEIERELSPEKEQVPQPSHITPQPFVRDSKAPSAETGDYGIGSASESVASAVSQAAVQITKGFAGLPGLGQILPFPQHALPQKPNTNTLTSPDNDVSASPETPPSNSPHQSNPQTAVAMRLSTDAGPVPGTRGSATPIDDEEDFYSPPPPADVDTHLEIGVEEEASASAEIGFEAANSLSEEGEVEMSVSSEDEEEYEPEGPAIVSNTPAQDAQLFVPEAILSIPTSQVSTEDEEDYEPPDVDQEMPDLHEGTSVAIPSNVVPPIDVEDGEMDIATSSSEESSDSDSDEESDEDSAPEPKVDTSTSTINALARVRYTADDLASEPRPEAVVVVEDEDEPIRFTPYESPLRMFKSYRYHPSYAQDISGGFLSWTFSHQIDPERLLCKYEAAGGQCNDSECADQHFRDIGITGEKLLVQLGTANPGKTSEEKQKWNDGLRGVLKELRTKNIKDPNGIAVEIAKYRRQFLNDDTRVVNL